MEAKALIHSIMFWKPRLTKKTKTNKSTYWLLPAKRCGWRPLRGSFGPRRRRRPRRVCCGGRGRFAGRKASRWAEACGESAGLRDRSPRARRLCTTLQWVWVGHPPYSWAWPAHPSIRSGQMGARGFAEGHPPALDGILPREKRHVSQWHTNTMTKHNSILDSVAFLCHHTVLCDCFKNRTFHYVFCDLLKAWQGENSTLFDTFHYILQCLCWTINMAHWILCRHNRMW